MVDADDLARAFEKAGLYGLTIHRRSATWGKEWFVTASWGPASDPKTKVRATQNKCLEAALVELLKMAPKKPGPSDEDDGLEGLL